MKECRIRTKGVQNMKKVLILSFVILALAFPVFASDFDTSGSVKNGDVGIGLNLGTNTGLGLKFGFGKFDINANIGLSLVNLGQYSSIGGDVSVAYEVYDWHIEGPHHIPITVGLKTSMFALFPYNRGSAGFYWDILAEGGLEYQIPDYPILVYLRVGLGIRIFPDVWFAGSGSIGCLYLFDY